MKFGRLYASKQEYKYSEYYLDYEYLKDNILNDNFKDYLNNEIYKIDQFFTNNKDINFLFLNFVAILKILKKYNKNNKENTINIDIIQDKEFYQYLINDKICNIDTSNIDNGSCEICYENDTELLKLKCNHSMCWNCLLKIYNSDIIGCPYCREDTVENPMVIKYESLTQSPCNPQYHKSMGIKTNKSYTKKLLFLGIDGLRPDALLFANTPNLDKIIKKGKINFETYLENDAISGQSWSTIFHGHNNHDVLFNEDVEDDNYFSKDNLITELNNKNINTISITNTWRGIYNITKSSNIKEYIDTGNLKNNDDLVINKTCEILKQQNKDNFIFSYICGIDKTGHKYGFSIQIDEYIKYIEEFDKSLTELIKLIDIYEYSLIISTDHGGSYYKDCSKKQDNIFRNIAYYSGQVKDNCKGIHGLDVPQHKRTFQIYYGNYKTSEIIDTLKNTDLYKNIIDFY